MTKKSVDKCTDICYYKCTDNKEVNTMSPKGRPTTEKKDKRFEIRISEKTIKLLEECSEHLKISKSQVIHKGIELVKKEIDKK